MDVTLTYENRSWRTRRTSVYLPVSRGEGEGEARMESMVLPFGWSASSYGDGVVMSLVIASNERQSAFFRFRQPLTQNEFRYAFGIPRGWGRSPQQVEVRMQAPAAWRMQFSTPPATMSTGSYTFRIDDHAELEVTWQ